jgi:16S rRNA (guanine1516-N2)-methyltransferase
VRRGLIEAPAVIGTTDSELAASLGLVLTDDCDYLLERIESGLQLQIRRNRGSPPLRIDFDDAALRRRVGRLRQELLLRVLGGPKARDQTVLDMTAGLGGDAFIMASYGMRVTMLERSPVLAALLSDGLARYRVDHPDLPLWLHHADSLSYEFDTAPDIIYLDPMYPGGSGSALNKLNLRVLRDLAGDDPDADQLLPLARRQARRRVVVKRPKRAPPLNAQSPDFTRRGKAVRWDVYLTERPQTSSTRVPP